MAGVNSYQLKFDGVQIIDVQFQAISGKPFNVETGVKFSIIPNVYYDQENKKRFTLVMDARLVSEDIFQLFFVALGHFEFVDQDIDSIIKKNMVETSAPAIMFPYLRAFVTTFTASLGSLPKPLIIPPQFFQGDIPELTEEQFSAQGSVKKETKIPNS
jgi:preprotein translocase subunit SecB